jgi:hypothetical protein
MSNESQIALITLALVRLDARFANTINSHDLEMTFHCMNLIVTRLALCFAGAILVVLGPSALFYANRCR